MISPLAQITITVSSQNNVLKCFSRNLAISNYGLLIFERLTNLDLLPHYLIAQVLSLKNTVVSGNNSEMWRFWFRHSFNTLHAIF